MYHHLEADGLADGVPSAMVSGRGRVRGLGATPRGTQPAAGRDWSHQQLGRRAIGWRLDGEAVAADTVPPPRSPAFFGEARSRLVRRGLGAWVGGRKNRCGWLVRMSRLAAPHAVASVARHQLDHSNLWKAGSGGPSRWWRGEDPGPDAEAAAWLRRDGGTVAGAVPPVMTWHARW